MKKFVFLLLIIGALISGKTAFAQDAKTETFKVYGNCGMCKKRIEKAAAAESITKAEWNVNTKIMTVTFDPSKTSNTAIQKKIAAAGHDTEKEKAADLVYDKLPGCCKYDRKGSEQSAQHKHH